MTPDERDQAIRDRVLTDPSHIPAAVTERSRLTITAQLVTDGSIVLFGIDIDLTAWPA